MSSLSGGSIQGKYTSCVGRTAVRKEAKAAPFPGL